MKGQKYFGTGLHQCSKGSGGGIKSLAVHQYLEELCLGLEQTFIHIQRDGGEIPLAHG